MPYFLKKNINIGYLHVEINNPFYLYSFLCKNKTLPAQTYFWHLAPPFIIGRVCLPSWNVKFLQGFISLLCLHVIGVPQVIINASVCNMWIFLCVLHKDRSQGFQFFMKLPNSDRSAIEQTRRRPCQGHVIKPANAEVKPDKAQ